MSSNGATLRLVIHTYNFLTPLLHHSSRPHALIPARHPLRAGSVAWNRLQTHHLLIFSFLFARFALFVGAILVLLLLGLCRHGF